VVTSLTRITVVGTESEAELCCGMLRAAGIECMHRITDLGFGAGGEVAASGLGAREVLVLDRHADAARSLLADGAP
jgi:hypothetical protein